MNLSVLPFVHRQDVIVVGAGIAGLATALELSHMGYRVNVFEAGDGPGGKIRQTESPAGPVDIGPTVLTLLPIFHELFEAIDENLFDHITPIRQKILARHWWSDGSSLDLFDDFDSNVEAIEAFSGAKSKSEFIAFTNAARDLFNAFDAPVMKNPRPGFSSLVPTILRDLSLLHKLRMSKTLDQYLKKQFRDPRLAQLFGRYATYVGGSPLDAPALMSLIWQAESRGVWALKGGMGSFAALLERLATDRGAQFHYGRSVLRIKVKDNRAEGIVLENGDFIKAGHVVYNGDPRALALGILGAECADVTSSVLAAERSLSAYVWGFSAALKGQDLLHHNVFFADAPNSEFTDIAKGKIPTDPTLYVCAQDRGKNAGYPALERFEIIMNAAPVSKQVHKGQEFEHCKNLTFKRLEAFGLTFQGQITQEHLTTPRQFEKRFPGSDGALYGQSPHGLTAAFQRPTAQTKIPNLLLVGGGAHPGAGMPMATLSARHAVAQIRNDQISPSMSHRTATRGGTSTA